MKCPQCHSSVFDEGIHELSQVLDHRPVLLKNVRALQCRQCGYLVISAEVRRQIECAMDQTPSEVVSVPVFDLARVTIDQSVA